MAQRAIVVRITLDNRDAINNAKAQAIAMKSLGDETQKATHLQAGLTNSFLLGNLAARAISVGYLALRDSLSYAVTETAQLELAMARTMAVAGLSSDGVSRLKESIFALSRTSLASTSELARTSLELSKLGIAGSDLGKVLAGVSNLSAILGDSLESTAALVSGVATTFNISGDEMTQIADKLFAATGKSITNIEGFKVAFSLAGNAAQQAGVSFEELSALIAVMSNQGIRASTIGTGLRTFFINMTQEGSKASKMLGTLGEKGLVGLMDEMARLKPDAGSLFEMFGKPGLPVAAGMMKSKESYEEFLLSINNSKGVLAENAKLINNTLIGSFQELKNSIVEVTSALLDTKAIRGFFQAFSESLQIVTDQTKNATAFGDFVKDKGLKTALNELKPFLAAKFSDGGSMAGQMPTDNDYLDAFSRRASFMAKEREHWLEEAKKVAEAERGFVRGVATGDDGERNSLKFPGDGKEDRSTRKLRQNLVDQFLFLDTALKKETPAETGLDLEQLTAGTAELRLQNEVLGMRAEIIGKNIDMEAEWAIQNQIAIGLQQALTAAVDQTAMAFSERMVASMFETGNAWKGFSDVMYNVTKQILANLTAMLIKMLAFKALSTALGFAAPGMTFASGGGFFTNAILSSLGGQKQFASGGSFTTDGPTPFVAGESGRERVQITPRAKMSSGGSQGITVVIQGNVFGGEQFNEAIEIAQSKMRGGSV